MIDSAVEPGTATKEELLTVFVSDVHLGSRFCQAEAFLRFLETHQISDLYLVGDFIDGWSLRRRWRWPVVYHRIFHQLLKMSASGTRLYYAPGNHDEFLRNYLLDFGFIEVADEFCYHSVSGRRFLVTHGDRFDAVEKSMPWLSMIGGAAYEFLIWLNHTTNRVRQLLRFQHWHFSSRVKQRVKRAVQYISDFEAEVAEYARQQQCDGIICGHIHAPVMRQVSDVLYFNTGDWVEHCTALIEHHDGSWEVRDYLPTGDSDFEGSRDGEDLLQHVGGGQGTRSTSCRSRRRLAASA